MGQGRRTDPEGRRQPKSPTPHPTPSRSQRPRCLAAVAASRNWAAHAHTGSTPAASTIQDLHPASEPSGQNSEFSGRAAFVFWHRWSTPEPTRDAARFRDRSMIPMVFVRLRMASHTRVRVPPLHQKALTTIAVLRAFCVARPCRSGGGRRSRTDSAEPRKQFVSPAPVGSGQRSECAVGITMGVVTPTAATSGTPVGDPTPLPRDPPSHAHRQIGDGARPRIHRPDPDLRSDDPPSAHAQVQARGDHGRSPRSGPGRTRGRGCRSAGRLGSPSPAAKKAEARKRVASFRIVPPVRVEQIRCRSPVAP